MKRRYANRRPEHKNNSSETRTVRPGVSRETQLSLNHDEPLGLMQESLEALAVELGPPVAPIHRSSRARLACGSLRGSVIRTIRQSAVKSFPSVAP